ncbi:hypothetical protein PHYPSEUDO_003156 [Phytophthora pseudosyringae]|uniref:Transmembrane protein n=1 Tax=Phytophthora pseudosyringae TaxID=221518 RepID=A0A8T1VRX4_9STRA|nr:hypothetical protein PHYPSEUDO_003156 [Phytophthora pseudosyringae]
MTSTAPDQETEHRTDDECVANSSPNRLYTCLSRLLSVWTSLQVSYYGGKYSIERSLALDEYRRRTSLSRVILVCIGTPLPMVALVILQELLPLQDPADGWAANYGFWLRLLMLSAVTANTFLTQGTFMVNGFVLSWRQLAVFITTLSLIHTAASMTVSSTLFFPIPFFYITMTPSFYIPLFTLLCVLLGKRSVSCVGYIATQKIMGMVYPAYQLLFHKAAATDYILPVVLLQPVLKLLAKNVVLHFTKDLEDLTPEAVIFTVDFYNSLYLATFMESASSRKTMLLLIGTDIAQTCMVLLKMRRRTDTILQRLRQTTNAFTEEDLLAALSLLCRNQDRLASQTTESIRVRSCLSHRLSPADNNLLFMLEKSVAEAPHSINCWPGFEGSMSCTSKHSPKPTSPLKKFQQLLRRNHSNSVHPTTAAPSWRRSIRLQTSELSISRDGSMVTSASRALNANVLREALAVLYTMECLVLTAYLEAFIPLFYGNYMMVMVNLPNAKYHTELKNVTRQNVSYTATVVFLFGLLQVASFGLLAALIQRKCGMNVLYQLAFVLETQMALVQGKLMIWMLVTLACRVVHFGVDYSFKFAWI